MTLLKNQNTLSFVTLFILSCLLFIALKGIADSLQGSANNDLYDNPSHLADLENKSVKESSGIAASRQDANLLWTNNDSGDGPFIYAFDRQGKDRGVWRIAGATAQDWEDIAIGPGPNRRQSYIYIGDIGDNSKKRDGIVVYRVAEPLIRSKDSPSTKERPRNTEAADVIKLKYPDGKHDAEALLVHPSTGDLYIVAKVIGRSARVYKLNAPFPKSGVSTLSFLGEIKFPSGHLGMITGGDISSDGLRVVLCDYFRAYELTLENRRGVTFDDIWKQMPVAVNIGDREQGEAICYRADGLALLATSEGLPCPLIEIKRNVQKH